MNFSLKPIGLKKPSSKPLFAAEDEDQVEPTADSESAKNPIDYLHLREEMAKRQAQGSAKPPDDVDLNSDERKEREALVRRRDEAITGRPIEKIGSKSSADVEKAGLVVFGDVQRGQSKHINRMVETAQVNEKFKNLLKIKISEREKDKAETEFGERPEEIITKAYLKQKEESLRLERELEASESKKRDMTSMFREMLESGSYARSNFQDTHSVKIEEKSLLQKISETPSEVEPETVKRILEKVVTEESKQVVRAVEQHAKVEALKIIQQIESLEGDDEGGDREQSRLSAKERYLQRKRQKMQSEEDSD